MGDAGMSVTDRLEAVVALRAEGLSGREIAERLGVTRRTVCRDLKRAGSPPKPPPPPKPDPVPEPEPEPVPEAPTPDLEVPAVSRLDLDLAGLPGWYADAACLGVPDLLGRDPWFHGDQAEAVAVCDGCPVRVPCLELALTEGHRAGVWGGTTPDQRAEIRKARHAA